jgi:hypothetical protein
VVGPRRGRGWSKYGAQPCEVDGVRFASVREARRWQELQLLARAGAIVGLRRQVRYPLDAVGGANVGAYVADFAYVDAETGQSIVEDAKGFRTPLYAWKARHFAAQYGQTIREV